jgi:hypothetical protein
MRAIRLTLALAFAVGVSSAALAAAPIVAEEVLVTTAPSMSIANAPGYTLRFQHDGTAIFDGPLDGRDGHYEATVDFAAVQAAITEAHLCERNGIPMFVEAPTVSHGMARADSVLVQLRCTNSASPNAMKVFNNTYAPDLPSVAETLLKLGQDLDWRYAGPARRQSGVRFAR